MSTRFSLSESSKGGEVAEGRRLKNVGDADTMPTGQLTFTRGHFSNTVNNETRQVFGFLVTNARVQTCFGLYDPKKLSHAGYNSWRYAVTMDIIPLFCHSRIMVLRYRVVSFLSYCFSDTTLEGFSNTNVILAWDQTGLTAQVSPLP
jgi:hypothetical protein